MDSKEVKNRLMTTNNKALYHKLGGLFDMMYDIVSCKDKIEEQDLYLIDAALKTSGQMISIKNSALAQAKLEKELDEYNSTRLKDIRIRHVEGKPYDRENGTE